MGYFLLIEKPRGSMEGGGSIGNLYLQIQVTEVSTYNIDLFLVKCLMLIHLPSWMFYQD